MYILFKKNVQSQNISEKDYSECMSHIKNNNKIMSNLTKYLFEHHEFLEHKTRFGFDVGQVQRKNREQILISNMQ